MSDVKVLLQMHYHNNLLLINYFYHIFILYIYHINGGEGNINKYKQSIMPIIDYRFV